jgi:hypothetical protein
MASDRDREEQPGERLPARATPYPVSRLGARIELVDLAREIERAVVQKLLGGDKAGRP